MENKLKEAIQMYLDKCKVYIDIPEKPLGGQQAGMITHPAIVESKDLGIKISVSYHRSNYKNKDFAMMLMALAISDLIK